MKSRFIVVLVVAAALVVPASVSAAPTPPRLSVILSAYSYPGPNGQWLGESGPFVNALTERADVTGTLPYCTQSWTGKLYGQPVLVVTMGTAKLESSQSAMNIIFSDYWSQVKEVIWSGIAGFSPRVGGYAGQGEPTIIGDVCIADRVGNWDLTFSSMVTQSFWPMDWPNRADRAEGDKALADELYAAAQKVQWPPLPAGPVANFKKYFPSDLPRQPKAWYGNCAEVTSDNFWHSSLDDAFARAAGSGPVCYDTGQGDRRHGDGSIELDASGQRQETITGRDIKLAYVRSSSNFDQPWDEAKITGQESIKAGMDGGGSDYGCITAALPVLKMFDLHAAAAQK